MTTLEKNKATLSNHLNLDSQMMGDVTHDLNNLLSDYHIFYQNLRGFHWNIKGNDFFTLHEQFEELYTMVYQNIDELAERIVTIGFKPLHSYSEYLKNSILNEVTDVEDAEESVRNVVDGLGSLVQSHRKIAMAAGEAGDIATEDLLTNFVGELEKRMWMFTKYLK
ncbi:Dps family protein [Algoriphagus namhaensis]|uniref:Dps family protein n=1 Tax=Algoriphagus namhaensis TaxID=915353 RepID=A0ABV8AUK3_9BACT